MPRLLSGVLVLALVSFAGCDIGDDDSNGKSNAKRAEKGKQDKKAQRTCEARGINVLEGKTGTCIRDKQRFTLVNRHSSLRLKELAVRLGKFSSKDTLPGPVGTVKPDKGKAFVLMDVTWRNRDARAHELSKDQKQLKLRIAEARFDEAMKAENAFPTSFFNQNKIVKPRGAQRGTVIFVVKATAVKALTQRGADPQLLVWNFSSVGKERPPDGAIRLWK